MLKEGISTVIASVLLILITIAGVTIIWIAVIPLLGNLMEYNEPVSLTIAQGGYTAWDPQNHIVKIQVKRGEDEAEIEGLNLILTISGDTIEYNIKEPLSKNNQRVYYINFSENVGELEMIKVAPVYVGGSEGDPTGILMASTAPIHDLTTATENEIIRMINDSDICVGSCESGLCGSHKICGINASCGSCETGYICSSEGVCEQGSSPTCTDTCLSLNYECGIQTVCSENKNCGSCPSGKNCVGATCISVATCSDNCATFNYECGSHQICGQTVNCGASTISCTSTFGACIASGTKTCQTSSYSSCSAVDPRIVNCAGKNCGSDGCGGNCGTCTGTCNSGQCSTSYFEADYYVDSLVSDCSTYNPSTRSCLGGNEKVFNTIQEAADVLTAGQTVAIRSGTYHEQVTPANSGSSGAYINYLAYNGESVILDGTDVSVPLEQGLIQIKKDYINVKGLRIQNVYNEGDKYYKTYGIKISSANNIAITNNSIYNTCGPGIQTGAASNIIIDGNELELNCNKCRGEILSIATTDNFEIKNNHVHDGGRGYEDWDGGEGIDIKEGSSNGKVYGNKVENLPDDMGIYVDSYGLTKNIEIYNNIVHSNENGIIVSSEDGVLVDNITIHHNLFYNNEKRGINIGGFWVEGPTPRMSNIKVFNNVAYDNGGEGIFSYGTDRIYTNIDIKNNILSGNNNQMNIQNPSSFNISYNLVDGTTSTTGLKAVEENPNFISSTNFHLKTDSPAIDGGTSVGLIRDFDGKLITGTPDIGAYEH